MAKIKRVRKRKKAARHVVVKSSRLSESQKRRVARSRELDATQRPGFNRF